MLLIKGSSLRRFGKSSLLELNKTVWFGTFEWPGRRQDAGTTERSLDRNTFISDVAMLVSLAELLTKEILLGLWG